MTSRAALEAPGDKNHGRFRVELVDPAVLDSHLEAWDQLGDQALEVNPFFESWFLRPALRHLTHGQRIQILLVWNGSQLVGLFPLVWQGNCKGIPWPVLSGWTHQHCFLGIPLIHQDHAGATLHALFNHLPSLLGWRGLLRFPMVDLQGKFATALVSCLNGRQLPYYEDPGFSRPWFQRMEPNPEEYLGKVMSSKSRKRLLRQEQTLKDRGLLEYGDLVGSEGKLYSAIDAFGKLEGSGWKGRAGTALMQSDSDWAFFRACAEQAQRRGRISMHAIQLENRPIAIDCNFHSGRTVFAFKTTFDESFADQSPGVLLEVHLLRNMMQRADHDFIDSCVAAPGSPLERLYTGRRHITTIIVPGGGMVSNRFVQSLPWARRWYARLRGKT
ncbi:MAG: GNAT family N-acetyltransferase [Gemmataceae bacterium]